jgi:hypothetical protein
MLVLPALEMPLSKMMVEVLAREMGAGGCMRRSFGAPSREGSGTTAQRPIRERLPQSCPSIAEVATKEPA